MMKIYNSINMGVLVLFFNLTDKNGNKNVKTIINLYLCALLMY
jgi:hypothetical protein